MATRFNPSGARKNNNRRPIIVRPNKPFGVPISITSSILREHIIFCMTSKNNWRPRKSYYSY